MIELILRGLFAATATVPDKACLGGGGNSCVTGLPTVAASSANLANLLAIVFGIIAAMAVLMVLIGGFRYVESQGDPQATAKARSTIVYAVVGLVLAVAAEAIVSLVLGRL